jgi:hypothetical protein
MKRTAGGHNRIQLFAAVLIGLALPSAAADPEALILA